MAALTPLAQSLLGLVSLENVIVFLIGVIIGYSLPRFKYKTFEIKKSVCAPSADALFNVIKIYKKGHFVKLECENLQGQVCKLTKQKCPALEPTLSELKKL